MVFSKWYDCRLILTGAYDNSLSIWSISNGECMTSSRTHTAPVKAVRWVPGACLSQRDGVKLAWYCRRGYVPEEEKNETESLFDWRALLYAR